MAVGKESFQTATYRLRGAEGVGVWQVSSRTGWEELCVVLYEHTLRIVMLHQRYHIQRASEANAHVLPVFICVLPIANSSVRVGSARSSGSSSDLISISPSTALTNSILVVFNSSVIGSRVFPLSAELEKLSSVTEFQQSTRALIISMRCTGSVNLGQQFKMVV